MQIEKVTRKGGTVEDESERRGTWMERGKKGLKESCRKKLNKGRGGQNEGDEEMGKEMHRGKLNRGKENINKERR